MSIAWKLIHDGSVCATIATITSYATRLGLRHGVHVHRSRKRGSFSASFPNEAWHLDATVLFTEAHEKLFLQLIIDNYSRKILAWMVSISISGLQTIELLKKAFASLIDKPPDDIDLVVDGGPENNNRSVEAFLSTTPIRKLIARVDVSFSNSMIEAVNKIIKYQYLFRTSIPDFEHAGDLIIKAIGDYNDHPHYTVKGLTPNQVYSRMIFDTGAYREKLHTASLARMEENRRSCDPCLPFDLESEEKAGDVVVE